MVRGQEPEVAKKLGDALAVVLENKKALIVASTDLSHFYEQKTASIFDHEMLSDLKSLRARIHF